ncbi:hypothetical protein [Cohnella laeviribosi]|uniref:hypothetical protein n=1 Tax=Cohnella laeviribosi TaxID=380174 RepID=UPI000361D80A|nr:hypothetical protein [Cohnella laeviribosi]
MPILVPRGNRRVGSAALNAQSRINRIIRIMGIIRFIRSVPLQADRFLMLKQQLFFPVAAFSQTQLLLWQFKARPHPFSA